jgi:hypothetical protein
LGDEAVPTRADVDSLVAYLCALDGTDKEERLSMSAKSHVVL